MAASSGRDEFPAFPFEPYAIQKQLMSAVYAALEKGGVAIVESPTGTGKTLSLICSVLQWLEDRKLGPAQAPGDSNSDEPDWMRDFSVSSSQSRKGTKEKEKLALHGKKRDPGFFGLKKPAVKRDKRLTGGPSSGDNDEEFLLDEYESSDENSTTGAGKRKQYPSSSGSSSSDSEEDEEPPFKVFFCSRTHSQLSQFIGELKRTKFVDSLTVISLGSRKALCVNQDVRKLGSAPRINDRCQELQKKKATLKAENGSKSQATGCPFIRKQKLQKEFKNMVLSSEPLDIEDLVQLGHKLGTCAYYGSRRSIRMSDVVVLPYQSLLHADTRASLGINLKNSIVIFDEAHNLVDTVANTYSCQLSRLQLKQVNSQLSCYLERFRSRLAPGNRRYIQVLLVLVEAFLKRIASCQKPKLADGDGKEILTINDFVFSMGIDNINLFKLCGYIKESNIVNKVSGYGDKFLTEQAQGSKERPGASSAFHALSAFIFALTTAQTDGRILLVSGDEEDEGQFKFLMLDAAKHFTEVVNQARAVILAGGTLQPVSEIRERLLSTVVENDINFFSCGHIVPAESILALAVAKGPSGKAFDFTYQSRSSPEMIEELGRLLLNVCSVVPEGIVVFFPSFEYEDQVHKTWAGSGTLASIEKKKQVFREPRSASAVEAVLEEYRNSVSPLNGQERGAVLLSVVGGKMSEGINFSDGMGRCVIMVGLPYPSPSDPELIERIKFIDQLGRTGSCISGATTLQQCGAKGKDYYENLCMKAVNQSIGRAIRHIGDYAAILLVDSRYTAETRGPTSKLPGWIKERLVLVKGGFGEVHRLLHRFFKHNRAVR